MPIYSSFQSGLNTSKYDQNGFSDDTNLDIHAQIGTAQPQLALVSESSTPNESCVQATAADGTVYFFSKSSGKTWKRTTGASYSLVNTNANGAHISAFYSHSLNRIIYTTSGKVGHLVTSTDTFTDSFGTFTNGSSYHPIEDVNLTVFIGDGKYVASINAALTFSANALDIPAQYSITALASTSNWLSIGTIIGTAVSKCQAFLWDTYSSSWSDEDTVYEVGINCFILADNKVYAQCGTGGNIYEWTGKNMVFYDTFELTTSVGQEKVTILNGKPLIAIGTGIYSIYKRSRNANDALCHEFTTTTGTIASIGVTGTQLLVSNGTNINKIDSNYATATVTSPLFFFNTEKTVEVPYESMPSGCSLGLESNINGSGWVSETFTNDSDNMKYFLDGGLTFNGKLKFGQVRVTLTPSTTTFPIIQAISIL